MPEKRTVAFIQETPSYRVLKLAKGLRRTGRYKLILCYLRLDDNVPITAAFDELFCYDFLRGASARFPEILRGMLHNRFDILDRRRLLSHLRKGGKVTAYHVISPPPKLCKWLIEGRIEPVIFDQYDLMIQSYGAKSLISKHVKSELFSLQEANGVIHKGPKEEIEYYGSEFRITPKMEMTFPDRCDDDVFVTAAKKIAPLSKEIHCVYVGGISSKGKVLDVMWLCDILSKQGIHLHIYPSQNTPRPILIEYERHQKENPLLHLHGSVCYSKLPAEIAKYHFGIYAFNPEFGNEDSNRKLRTAAGNKIPAYWEAGLPIIILRDLQYSAGIVKDLHGGIEVTLEELNHLAELILRQDYNSLIEDVHRARDRFSLYRATHELEKFYEKLIVR